MHVVPRIIGILLAIVTASAVTLTPGYVVAKSVISASSPQGKHDPNLKPGPNCAQPPRNRDPKTLSDAERAKNGYPHRVKGKDFSKVDADMQHFGTHFCQDSSVPLKNSPKLANFCYQPGNTQPCDYGSNGWAGNIADGNDYLPPYWQFETYNEADFNFSITCPNAGWHDGYAQWVGLGGVNDNNHLIQVGEEYTGTLGIGIADLVWENPADGSLPQDFNLNISCGDYMMGQVYAPNCMYAYDLNLHKGAGPICSGPAADENTAEFITERLGFYTSNPTPLSNFGNLEFDSCGVTVNNVGYRGIGATLHDYTNMYTVWQTPGSGGHALATTGPIWGLPGATPPDSFNVYWKSFT